MKSHADTTNVLVIIEDDPTDLLIYQRFLRAEHHTFSDIMTFSHPDEALAYVKNATLSCCLLDFHFPGGGATEFIQALKTSNADFPIVVSTGRGDERLAVELMQMGVQDYLVKESLTSSLLIRTLNNAIHTHRLQQKLEYMAHYDGLTGLLNRALFMDRLEQAVSQAQRYKRQMILLFLDLDHFKQINDTYGHDVGDKVLVTVANRLRQCVRDSDSVARLGGDEFAVLLPEASVSQGHFVAQKLLQSIPLAVPVDSGSLTAFPSIGLASFPECADSAQELLKKADVALYKAKEQGRAQYVEFSKEHTRQWRRKCKLIEAIADAIKTHALHVVYQPIYRFETGQYDSVEALIRWRYDNEDIAAPEIIDIVLEASQAAPFHEWLFEETLRQLSQWREQAPALTLSLNMPIRLLHSKTIIDSLNSRLAAFNLPPGVFRFEISEVNFKEQASTLISLTNQLFDKGYQFAISDFGIGDCPVELLVNMPCSQIKIDKHFISNWNKDDNYQMMVSALISFAHHLQIDVVAVGIEHREIADWLKEAGCDLGQGYWLAEPHHPEPDWQQFLQNTHGHSAVPANRLLKKTC